MPIAPDYISTSITPTDIHGLNPVVPVSVGGTSSLPVVLQAGSALIGSVTSNVSQWNGTTTDTNSGTKSAGTLRVVIATDQPQLTNKLLVTPDANVKVNCVGNAGASFDGATAASVPANALLVAGRGATANPTAVTDGQLVAKMCDKVGRQVVVQGQIRDLVGVQQTTIAGSSSETTIVTAGASGVFNDITSLVITMGSTPTACTATLKDSTGGTTRAIYDLPGTQGGAPLVIAFNPPLPQASAANNWTITLGSASPTVHINAVFVKNV